MRKTRAKLLPLTLAVVSGLLIFTLGGCTNNSGDGSHGRPTAKGPLVNGVDGRVIHGFNCVPGGEPQTFGDQLFTNHGAGAVVLDGVTLLHPHNERIIGSYAVPGLRLVGVVPWPPKHGLPPTWKNRQPIRGFRVDSGKSFNMVLGAESIKAGRATSQGLLVHYHDVAGTYVTKNYFAMIIAATKRGCR